MPVRPWQWEDIGHGTVQPERNPSGTGRSAAFRWRLFEHEEADSASASE
jgi:hypothetical protein